jgi:hypothetical protein
MKGTTAKAQKSNKKIQKKTLVDGKMKNKSITEFLK